MILQKPLSIDKNYDSKLKINLEARLNRPATPSEIINSDRDADLVNETLWQLIVELEQRILILEQRDIIK